MRGANAGLQALSVFAILFILGFGFVVYAIPQTAPSESGTPVPYEDQSPTAVGAGLSYSLVPLPDSEGQPTPSSFPFQEGGALIVVYGTTLAVTTSFIGSPKTTFVNIIQTAGSNLTVGSVTTSSTGGAVFHGNITLSPGTYKIGLLLFVDGQTSSPVAVSSPRSIAVTLGSPGSTSTTTRTESSVSSGHETTTYSVSSSSSGPTGANPSSVSRLSFQAVTTATIPRNYSFGQGSGAYSVSAGTVYFSLSFSGQQPQTRYSIVLTVNGAARTIGDYTTSSEGAASLGPDTFLGTGTFALSMSVVDDSTFGTPTTVLVSVPATLTVTTVAPTSSTSTSRSTSQATTSATSTATTSEFTETAVPAGPNWTFKLTQADVQNVPKGYKFAASGTAIVTLDPEYSLLYVEIGFQGANPTTTYTAAITLNGTSMNLGTMTTNRDGGALLKSSIQVDPGQYVLGILVYDISDIPAFGANGPVLVMVSNPSTEVAIMIPPGGETSTTSSAESTNTVTQTSVSSITGAATTLKASTPVLAQIQTAVQNLTIPASIQITPLASTTNVYDDRFSLSVGQVAGNGVVVAISGENITGSRVLLINMSRTSPLALYPALNVTLDGVPVAEASSALQVLNPVPSNPPYYVLVGTSDSIQLLVSIPHFSLHLVQISGVIVHTVQSALEVDGPLLVGSIIVVTLAFLGAYATRRRYFTLFL